VVQKTVEKNSLQAVFYMFLLIQFSVGYVCFLSLSACTSQL
jgi:hypothetical protein